MISLFSLVLVKNNNNTGAGVLVREISLVVTKVRTVEDAIEKGKDRLVSEGHKPSEYELVIMQKTELDQTIFGPMMIKAEPEKTSFKNKLINKIIVDKNEILFASLENLFSKEERKLIKEKIK